jgi:hypothetical protein
MIILLIAGCFTLMVAAAAQAGGSRAEAAHDAFQLWRSGAFRGANTMLDVKLEDFRVLRSWGANLAEIPVMAVYDARPPYQFRPQALEELDRSVRAAEEAGLFLVLTCRTGPGRADFETSQEIWRDAEAQAAYARMWAHLARHYQGRKSIVGYDLMCEPHPDERDALVWNKLTKQVTRAIRAVDPSTPILINSVGWAYPQTFDALEPTGDERTVYVVHFYDPHYYTHQRPRDKRPYPGFVVPDDGGAPWDKVTIGQTLAPVRRFQQKHKVPIFAGEFGCARYAPGAVEWLRDQIDLYEKWGWSWAYWAFREWDVMDIEKTAEASDRKRYPDTPLLTLFRSHFARNKVFLDRP